ncbi:hypothetical protein C8R44DRAFT_853515 [Mycena epipterygia]|nr:hypothetical protein C8R44DRAFT_853515 [Mycena epipterygia]
MIGFCLLPDGKMSSSTRNPYYLYSASETSLPPAFDLHRYITHVTRGITHFHGSFWPLPRRLSDAAFEAAEPPSEWIRYMRLQPEGFGPGYGRRRLASFDFDNMDAEVFGVAKRDGTRVQLFKYDKNVSGASFDNRPAEIAKVDTTEFKKLLDDPSRRLCMVPVYEWLSNRRKSIEVFGPLKGVCSYRVEFLVPIDLKHLAEERSSRPKFNFA